MQDTTTLLAELPQPTRDSEPFWEGCNAEQLLLQRCGECNHIFYYPRRLCPTCGSTTLQWEQSRGRGRIYSFSEVHVPFQGPQWTSQLPYTVVLVDLDEGPRMLSRWLGTAPPCMGQVVHVCWPRVDHQKLPFFGPDEE